MSQPKQQPQPKEPPRKVIALVSNGHTTHFNPDWQLAPCPNCNGRKCALCNFKGAYHE